MLKMIKRGVMTLVIVVIAIMGNSVFAEENTLTHYEPYSAWSKDVGFKYNLIFLEKPQRSALRWEIVYLLDGISDVEDTSNGKSEVEFTDLNDVSEEIRKKIMKATENGYISGYADKTFKPFNNVSRGEFVALLDRFGMLEKSKKKSDKTFADVDNHWSKEYVYKAVAEGIISGKSESTFCPDDTITLEEILIILDRMEGNGRITSNEVLSAILGTFYTRQYDESEKFMVEDIYGDMEQIQHDMWVYRNSVLGYDYTDISRKVTVEDVLTWLFYYYDNGIFNANQVRLDDSNRDRYLKNVASYTIWDSNGYAQTAYYFGITPEEPIPYDNPVTVKEFLHIYDEDTLLRSTIDVKFSNFSTFSDEEKKDVERFARLELIPNSTNEFPIDEYMTCALLNYITVKLNHCEPLWRVEPLDVFTYTYYFNEYCNSEAGTYHTEMDENTWPSNYEQYPFIMRPISNEAYEIPFMGIEAQGSLTPIQLYEQRWLPSKSYGLRYINTVINIDCDNINREKIKDNFDLSSPNVYSDQIDRYINYVKAHNIKLEGTCSDCLPIVYYDASGFGRIRMRFHVEFKILSSDTNVNILFDDYNGFGYEPGGQNDVYYEGNEFEFYIDLQYVTSGFQPKVEAMNPFVDSIVMQKKGNITR